MKSEKTVISVIVPVYNAANYLESLLESLQRQTYTDLDILLIDDGSTDDSAEMIQKYSSQDDRIRYISCIHGGVSAARNVGISQARGTYIRFLDADDSVPDDSMEKLLYAMESDEEIDFVCGSFWTDTNKISYFRPDNLHGKTPMPDFVLEFGRSALTFYYGAVWNKLYRKELIDKYHILFNESLEWCEDLVFNIEYFCRCKYVYLLDESVYAYIDRENSATKEFEEVLGNERMQEINQFRYQKSLDLMKNFDCDSSEFTDSWDYISLKATIDGIAGFFTGKGKSRKHKDLRKRYLALKSLLGKQENVALLSRRYTVDPDRLVQILYKFSAKGHYASLFILLLIKDFIGEYCGPLKKVWNKRKRKGSVL